MNDIGDINHCGMHPLQIPAFVQVMLSQNIKEHCSYMNLHLTADLQAIKMKNWLQGYTALHKDTCKAPYTYSLDIKTSTYGKNYKHDDGAKVRGYKESAESRCTPTIDEGHLQIVPGYYYTYIYHFC